MKFNYSIIALSLLFIISCTKEEEETPVTGLSIPSEGVMVINEGQFNANNASVTIYGIDGKQVDNVYSQVNDKNLGDVFQSVMETELEYFMVINNSSKIEVVDKKKFSSIATLEGFVSPRYMLDMKNGKALVTNASFASPSVAMTIDVVNLSNYQKEQSIAVMGWCEGMDANNNNVYVANASESKVLVINKSSLSIIKEISTPASPKHVKIDKNGYVWVMCEGDFSTQDASLVKIDPSDNTVALQLDFPTGIHPDKMTMNGGKGSIYFLVDGVYKMSVGSTNLSYELIPNTKGTFYGLGIHPTTSDIYIGDAKDFISNGVVTILNSNGDVLDFFESGVSPNGFVFREKI